MELKTMKVCQREHPIIGYVETKQRGTILLVDIPMMSDYRWHLSSLNSRLDNPELYRAAGEDVEATIAQLRETLAQYDDNGNRIILKEAI